MMRMVSARDGRGWGRAIPKHAAAYNHDMEKKEMEEKGGMFMEKLRAKKGFICDMDGVIYWGGRLLPGVKEFVDWLQREGKRFLF